MSTTVGDAFLMPVARDSESVSMLRGLSARESHTREDTVAQCRSMFQVWYFGLVSPPAPTDSQFLLDGGSGGHCGDPSMRRHIEEQLPELLRLARAAPLADVREKAGELLSFVEESLRMRLPRPRQSVAASEFIPQRDLIPLDPEVDGAGGRGAGGCCGRVSTNGSLDADGAAAAAAAEADGCVNGCSHDLDDELIGQSQALLADQFHEWHRSGHVFHVMAYHPAYLDSFLQFHNSLLLGAGPIGAAERHYLAVMAAARHRCAYLVHLHSIEFIHLNGDVSWLSGLEHASPKMRKLGPLCRLLAHRPWEVTSATLRSLLSGPDSLSQSELLHSMCLLTHFAALAGFVAGTGVRPEIDSPLGHSYRAESGCCDYTQQQQQPHVNGANGVGPAGSAPSSPGVDPKQRVLELMNAIKDLEDEAPDAGTSLPEDQLLQRFECVEQENADIRFIRSLSREQQPPDSRQELVNAELASFCQDPAFDYKDFHQAKADGKLRSFRIQDYSWEEDGSCLVDRYLPSVGCELDERFQTSFNLTYGTMGFNENVETAPFRRAVWYYVHSIFGMRHDDYDYNLINKMLSIELKKYCKLVACCPEQVTRSHYRSAMPGFKHSEKVHVNLVIMDARLQASMLYGLRALNNHMTGQ